jgi:hypothetical protein
MSGFVQLIKGYVWLDQVKKKLYGIDQFLSGYARSDQVRAG